MFNAIRQLKPEKQMKPSFSFLVCCLVVACATTQTIDVSLRTNVFQADYLTTFKAVVDYCNDGGFAIVMADKELGILNTDYKESGGASSFFFGNSRAKINFSLKKVSETETKVIVTISGEKQGAFGSWTQATMTEGEAKGYYQSVFEGVQARLNK